MSNDRLRQLEKNLTRLREQLGGKENALITAPAEEKIRIKQQIRDLHDEIHPYEQEYWQILADEAGTLSIEEPQAEIVVAEIVQEVGQIEAQPSANYPDEVLQILRQIRDKLNEPGTPAAAKLKGVISSIPPFIGVSYEAELDTENFLRKHFPTFTRWIKGAAKK
jgi:DNA repair exonuclease SbcCD ATPase subunit